MNTRQIISTTAGALALGLVAAPAALAVDDVKNPWPADGVDYRQVRLGAQGSDVQGINTSGAVIFCGEDQRLAAAWILTNLADSPRHVTAPEFDGSLAPQESVKLWTYLDHVAEPYFWDVNGSIDVYIEGSMSMLVADTQQTCATAHGFDEVMSEGFIWDGSPGSFMSVLGPASVPNPDADSENPPNGPVEGSEGSGQGGESSTGAPDSSATVGSPQDVAPNAEGPRVQTGTGPVADDGTGILVAMGAGVAGVLVAGAGLAGMTVASRRR